MTEEIFSKDLINLEDCTSTKFTDVLRTCRNEFLHDSADKHNDFLQVLTKDLASKIIENSTNENDNENDEDNTSGINDSQHLNNTPQTETSNFTLSASITTNPLEISAANNTSTKSSIADDENDQIFLNTI